MGIRLKNLMKRFIYNFPFCYHDEIVFYKPDEFDSIIFMHQLATEFHAPLQGDTIKTDLPVSLSKMPIRAVLVYKPDNVTGNVSITLSLLESNLALLLFIPLGFFFNYYQYPFFGYLSIIIGVLYYLINIHVSSTTIKRTIIKVSGTTFDLGEPELWKKQQKWMKDPLLCPACGEPINSYSYKCINCGIYLSKPPAVFDQVQVNTTGTEKIVYQYNSKNEKNSR